MTPEKGSLASHVREDLRFPNRDGQEGGFRDQAQISYVLARRICQAGVIFDAKAGSRSFRLAESSDLFPR